MSSPFVGYRLNPILVVEDHEDTRDMVELFLQLDGFSVCTAADGVEAFECLVERRPCLILLDLSMPIMDGITFGRELRRHPDRGLAATPIVLLTALSNVDKAMEATGAIAHIAKPIDFDEFVRTVHLHCGSRTDT
jgi:CheY-like chemotaxis protein